MATRSTSTPPKQGSPSASMDPPATPASKFSTTPALATPKTRQRALPPATPGPPITSPFPARTPRTPSGTVNSCTSDDSLFNIVTVHTAKCTECDKRNRDTMRRCPGCTFQVCKPCYERREREGRGLMHGNLMSSAATPTTQRTVRKKPLASTPGSGSKIGTQSQAKNEEVVVETEGEGSAAKKVVEGKKKEKTTPTPRPLAGKKRAARKKPLVQDSTSEESDDDDDDFVSDLTSPTPSKRRRTALAFDGTTAATTTPSTRATRKPLYTASIPTDPSSTKGTLNAPESTGFSPSELNHDDLLHQWGVKGYDEPLLGRRQPVMSNPVIEIPDIVKRNFKPRPTQEEIQKNLQESTLKKIQGKALKHMEAQRKKAEEEAYPHTVRAFVETEAAEHHDDVTMDKDENEALISAMRDAARKWSNQTHNKLDLATQNLVRRGLDMRLDKINEAYKAELAALLTECAAHKLQELAQDTAPSAAATPGQETDSTQCGRDTQDRLAE